MLAFRRLFSLLACSLLVLVSSPTLRGQVPGVTREQMWYAPTEADWKKPVLIQWQRTWEDAVAVSKETGKPILICVNMDGEIASEHYAGVRYRMPEIAKLYEPYVCVIASTYRHNPRDYDEAGNRIPCPRFGGVTCGEHISIEPFLFERFMEGQRVAPRHIMVELDGKEVYDVYYAFDTDSVFAAIKNGIAERKTAPKPVVRGDRSLIEKVASKDAADRAEVEKAWREGDEATRRALLEAAGRLGEDAPPQLLRQGIYSLDEAEARRARELLAQTASPRAVPVIGEALDGPLAEKEREALLAALGRLGEESAEARRLASVHRGVGTRSRTVDVGGWVQGMGGATYAPPASEELIASRLDEQAKARASKDPVAHVNLAEAFLARARAAQEQTISDRRIAAALFADAEDEARRAEELGAKGWRVNAVLALCALERGEREEAHRRAERAVSELPSDPRGMNSMLVLWLYAESRRNRIVAAVEAKRRWEPSLLSDMHAAHEVLLRHPEGNVDQAVSHYDLLAWLGARRQAATFLKASLVRFPDSWRLHERFRRRVLRRQGVAGLAPSYARLVERVPEASRALAEWYAGYASIVEAEFYRRRNRPQDASKAYERGLEQLERAGAGQDSLARSVDHYVALIHAGRARMALEAKDLSLALEETLASFERSEESAATQDGLNISPVDTAKMLLSALREAKDTAGAERLQKAMDALDPALLELPAYEGQPAGGRRRGGRSGRGGGSGR